MGKSSVLCRCWAGDLTNVLSQEVKILDDGSGLVFQIHLVKVRCLKGKNNSFVQKVQRHSALSGQRFVRLFYIGPKIEGRSFEGLFV